MENIKNINVNTIEIYLYRFFINEKYRNQGIGTIALNKIIDMTKRENKDISLEVMGENVARDIIKEINTL